MLRWLCILFLSAGCAHGAAAQNAEIRGVVFEDPNGDGIRQPTEPGVPGVLVSNGLEVVPTDAEGVYVLPGYSDMNLTVVQPSGWRVPVDDRQVPQFFHVHKEAGSPVPFRYGGLPASGPPPPTVNFPLRRAPSGDTFRCAVLADPQVYSHTELDYFRDGVVAELLSDGPGRYDCILYLGDVVGDDLSLLPRLLELGSAAGAPQWLVFGNHDVDADAPAPDHAADTWRRIYGPDYYAFEMGQAVFVVLNNVVYPCAESDGTRPGREFCNVENPVDDAFGPDAYNGRIAERQVAWLANLLQHIPPDRLVVLAHHIPFVSFEYATSAKHQTDNATEIYTLLTGRPALSLSGHNHTMENHAPGQHFAGWDAAVGVGSLPFRHIIVGAASGSWWMGDLLYDGTPMALQRLGEPRGWLILDVNATEYRERYVGAGLPRGRKMWLGLNTPSFRTWFDEIEAWRRKPVAERDPVPPLSINDLTSTGLLTREDLVGGTWLTANVWAGSAETVVHVSLNGASLSMHRTQEGAGEEARIGAEWADPFAIQRQFSIARIALQSRSGEPRNQGYEIIRGWRLGPSVPGPGNRIADRNMHLWRVRLPEDLTAGVYLAEVTATDRHGRDMVERLVFEVRAERPPPRWQHEPWQD